MAGLNKSSFKNPVVRWIDERLPVFTMLNKEYGAFPTPRNFNYLWNFGAIAMVMLGIMIVSGVVLAMHYTPNSGMAFDSVERIMRDVNYGWLIRYIHMNGASFFFIAVYIHIFRGFYYGSYKAPRELLWIFGVVIFLLMMATAFMGYTLPWSQMSGWGATVITNLFSAFPLVGDAVVTWLWGGFSVDNPTLNRFFALHYLLPFIICAVVFLHVWALHVTGSGNPTGVEPKSEKDTVPFHPYYTAKDSYGLMVFMLIFAVFVFFLPLLLTHPDHFRQFDPLVTPPHIVPEWYFLPFYAILRAFTADIIIPFTGIILVPAKLQGVIAMFGSILLWAALPWLDRSPVRSCRYRPVYKWFLFLLVIAFIALGYAGAQKAEGIPLRIGQAATFYYFLHFLVVIPWLGRKEKPLILPASIEASLIKKAAIVLLACILTLPAASAQAAEDGETPPAQSWHHKGVFGTYDRAQLQRGFQVYKEVCAACHSMNLLSYRHLEGIGLTGEQIKAIAGEYMVTDGPNDEGEMFERPGKPSDRFHAPFPNDKAAAASNNGAVPPDFSLIAKARAHGEDYIFALLTGYEDPPADEELLDGQYWNRYFPGYKISMAPPLSDGQVVYADGTEATTEMASRDVSAFLAWASEPHMEARKYMGLKTVLFLLAFAGVLYMTKRKVWSSLK